MLLTATRRWTSPDWMRPMEDHKDNLRGRKPDRLPHSDLFQRSFLVLSNSLGPQFVIKILLISFTLNYDLLRSGNSSGELPFWALISQKLYLCLDFNFALLRNHTWEFPGGPVVKTWLLHSRGLGSIPGRELSFHKLSGMAQKIK